MPELHRVLVRRVLSACLFVLVVGPVATADDARYVLRMGTYVGDILLNPPAPFVPAPPDPAPGDPVRRIVQFHRGLTRDERRVLQGPQFGLRLDDYLGTFAYLEEISEETLALLPPGIVRGHVLYASRELKLTSELTGMIGAASGVPVEIRAILFDDAVVGPIKAALDSFVVGSIEEFDYQRFGHGFPAQTILRFTVAPNVLESIVAFDDVREMETVGAWVRDNGTTTWTLQSASANNTPVWDRQIFGHGQMVHVIEKQVGIDLNNCWFHDPAESAPSINHRKVKGTFGNSTADDHATFVAGIVAGDDFGKPGQDPNRGIAWGADLFSSGLRFAEELPKALVAAASAGATIHTNSWHLNKGKPTAYDEIAKLVDAFTWAMENQVVVGSAGNTGDQQGPPGTAKNALGVSAADKHPDHDQLGSGNPGPTKEDRRKPDLNAPGCEIVSSVVASSPGACRTTRDVCASSWAAPAVAAAAALTRQYYGDGWYPTGQKNVAHVFEPSGALLKATLLNATVDMGVDDYPGDFQGWGRLVLDDALYFSGDTRNLQIQDVRNIHGLATGEGDSYRVQVADSAMPLKITLVWTEPPPGSKVLPIVNDLDLRVHSPDGKTYLGNAFAGGESSPLGDPDRLNNVEQVLVIRPTPGEWNIDVVAEHVAVMPATPNLGQGYALVAAGLLPTPVQPNQTTLPTYSKPAKGLRHWLEVGLAAGGGKDSNVFLQSTDDPDPQPNRRDRFQGGGVEIDYRFTRFKRDQDKQYRSYELAFGWNGSWIGQEDATTARQSDYGAWGYYEKNLSPPKGKFTGGLFYEFSGTKVDEITFAKTHRVVPALSVAWKEGKGCDTSRSVFYASYEDFDHKETLANPDFDRDGGYTSIGAQHSLVKEPARTRDWRCGGQSVFRRLYLEDRRSLHFLYEHRWEPAGREYDRQVDRVEFEGQIPIPELEFGGRRLAFDWRFEHSRANHTNPSFFGTTDRRDRVTHASAGFIIPLVEPYSSNRYAEVVLRIGGGHIWHDSNTGFYDYDRGFYTLMFDAVLGVRHSKGIIRDVPSPGGTIEPGTGSGPQRPRRLMNLGN